MSVYRTIGPLVYGRFSSKALPLHFYLQAEGLGSLLVRFFFHFACVPISSDILSTFTLFVTFGDEVY